MRRTMIIAGFLAVSVLGGCTATPHMTDTTRTGIERLLLSTAADRSIDKLDVSPLSGKTTFLDVSKLETNDKGYTVNEIRDELGRQGLLLTDDKAKAEVIIEARAGAMDTDSSSLLIGIPAIPIPLAGVGTLVTPELALFKRARQYGTVRIALTAIDSATGKQLLTTGPRHGKSYFTRWVILIWVMWDTSDIPEAKDTWY